MGINIIHKMILTRTTTNTSINIIHMMFLLGYTLQAFAGEQRPRQQGRPNATA